MLINISDEFSKNKKIKIKPTEIYSKISLQFLKDFTIELRRNKNIKNYPDLIYLVYWCNNCLKSIKKNHQDFLSLGRGLAFHICPSNVPTNFIYSFIFGLLSGNSNIVKMPSKPFKEKEVILSVINNLFKKKIYKELNDKNQFIEYSNKDEITKILSSKCDVRIIWGGDKTINAIRKHWIPEKTIDVTFADRYSFAVINVDKLKKEKSKNFKNIVNKFYYDGYMMNQKACNSPHFIFWVGKFNKSLQDKFWKHLNDIVEKKFFFDDIHVVEKYSNLMQNIIKIKKFDDIKRFKNNLFVLTLNKKNLNIENIRGSNGIFFQKNVKKLSDIKRFITKKCQTISYYGITKKEFKIFLSKNNLLGVDRIVPIGNALEIDTIWDGYDVIRSLSRVITHK
tara:strand:- start:461 stop:1642 length:1182 start_codon:yes stop_codon:yes gene_type:complete